MRGPKIFRDLSKHLMPQLNLLGSVTQLSLQIYEVATYGYKIKGSIQTDYGCLNK